MSADFLLYDPNGKLIACVGVAGVRESTPEWATEIMGDFLGSAEPPYLILVTRDQTYFWKDPVRNADPGGTVPTSLLLDGYLRIYSRPLAEISPYALEDAVYSWLFDATYIAGEVPDLLRAIGFIDAIHNGDVKVMSAA